MIIKQTTYKNAVVIKYKLDDDQPTQFVQMIVDGVNHIPQYMRIGQIREFWGRGKWDCKEHQVEFKLLGASPNFRRKI